MKLLTIEQVAKELQKSYGYVKKRIEQGEIKAMKIGNTFRIPIEEVKKFKESFNESSVDGYSIEEVANKLNVSYGLINSLIKKEEIKATKIGRKYIITHQEFERYIASNFQGKNAGIDDANDSNSNTINNKSRIDVEGESYDNSEDSIEGIVDSINKINKLMQGGAISQEEFEKIKKHLLAKIQ